MTLKPINFSTGPVEIRKEVFEAMASAPVSHRSPEFINYFDKTITTFKNALNVADVSIMTGSGTLANEAMIWQIKANKGKGLVLVNGEFGRRLKKQAKRDSLDFMLLEKQWGEKFELAEIESTVKYNNLSWILFCHLETSTGVLNDIEKIGKIARDNNCKAYVDCMSTVGTMPINLKNIELATSSSGKGIGSIAGVALVFSNSNFPKIKNTPKYLDLRVYKKKGIPFTISSNLVEALSIASSNNLEKSRWDRLQKQSEYIYDRLSEYDLLPYAEAGSRVFA